MSRIAYRVLMGMTVLPFVVSGWLWSVWLSEYAVQAAEQGRETVYSQVSAD